MTTERLPTDEPKLTPCYCSQCGGYFGIGTSGFSHCEDHPRGLLRQIKPVRKADEQTARKIAT